MSYRVDSTPRDGRRARARRWAPPLVAGVVAAVLGGAWACAPRAAVRAAAVVQPPVAQGFVRAAAASPIASPVPAPAPAAPPVPVAAPAPPPPAPAPVVKAEPEPEVRAAAPAFRIEAEHEMSSTMYCLKGNTRTGVRTRDGIAAADPRFLPLGSVVRLSLPDGSPLGVFVVMDTGGAVKGNKIDVYVDDCREAVRWGRRKVVAQVLALGRGGD